MLFLFLQQPLSGFIVGNDFHRSAHSGTIHPAPATCVADVKLEYRSRIGTAVRNAAGLYALLTLPINEEFG